MLESIFVHIFEDCNYYKNKMASLYICAQSFARVTPQGHHTGEKSLDDKSCICNNTTYIIFYCFSYVIKCTFESPNRKKPKKKKNRKNIQQMEGLPRPEVTSLLRDYLSWKVTKYFTDIISYLCPLFFMQNLQNYLLQPHFSILSIYANYAKFKVTWLL